MLSSMIHIVSLPSDVSTGSLFMTKIIELIRHVHNRQFRHVGSSLVNCSSRTGRSTEYVDEHSQDSAPRGLRPSRRAFRRSAPSRSSARPSDQR